MNIANISKSKSTPKEKISTFIYYFSIIACIILVLNTLSARSEAVYKLIGFRSYTVLSGSMEPEFYPGDLVVSLHKNRANIKEGDIITFRDNDEIVTHRIIDKTQEGYITKGDNNNAADSFAVSNDNIIGKVLFDIPNAGYIIQFLAKPMVIAIELMLGAIIILLYNRD
ncbi:signal peptidase I [Romboutsia sedimentorum]|uniref:Signal peptidase I n=1 Tax=Romboutsia sedimentorum TaxID=1368474 RepID=A0ABT7E7R4_9FIRM|nr:signal peptidase I [Romboutsia sedimentorum]MDK2562963.1 signal peptidase I [Romboutsia sedimentorum]MDK2586316.1 signal peptidase I [Romboutsia sedimentorum]